MIENPSSVECTMKITMPLEEWENLRNELQNKAVSSRLSGAITSMISASRKVYYSDNDAMN